MKMLLSGIVVRGWKEREFDVGVGGGREHSLWLHCNLNIVGIYYISVHASASLLSKSINRLLWLLVTNIRLLAVKRRLR